MKRILFLPFALLLIAIGCSKSKFETVPQVEIKSLTPDAVAKGEFVTLKARVTDKEGDLQDTVIIVAKYFLLDGTELSADTINRISLETLEFPDTRDIEVQIQFRYGELTPPYEFINLVPEDQNFSIGLIVRDKAGNRSNYAESGRILLKKL